MQNYTYQWRTICHWSKNFHFFCDFFLFFAKFRRFFLILPKNKQDMRNKNLIACYAWVAEIIGTYNGLTYEQVNQKWLYSPLSDGNTIPRRTFTDWIIKAEEMLDINIDCDRRTNKYHINSSSRNHNDNLSKWLINSMNVTSLTLEAKSLRERIIFENIPSGNNHISTIIDAMKHSNTLQMTYEGFGYDAPYLKEVAPYALKVFKQRWYMLCATQPLNKIRIFALDRITNLEPTTNHFRIPRRFSPAKYFHNSYGIYSGEDFTPQTVRMKADIRMRDFLRTLPLHSSQKEVKKEETFSVFSYKVCITPDLIYQILSFGSQVEVISPLSLREQIASTIGKMYSMYSGKQIEKKEKK